MIMPSPKLAAVTIVGMLVYLVLVIAGWGGPGPYFAHPARVALTVVLALLTAAALFSGGNLSPGEHEDRANRWVLAAFGVLSLLSAYLPALCDRKDIWTIDGDAARWTGVALFAGGGVLRLWPVFVLGRRFSGLVAIQKGHALVTSGVYGVIRHPSYLGYLIMCLGWGLAFRSILGVVLGLLNLLPLLVRIRAEEALLAAQFGDEYAAYRARTWRLVPGLF